LQEMADKAQAQAEVREGFYSFASPEGRSEMNTIGGMEWDDGEDD